MSRVVRTVELVSPVYSGLPSGSIRYSFVRTSAATRLQEELEEMEEEQRHKVPLVVDELLLSRGTGCYTVFDRTVSCKNP